MLNTDVLLLLLGFGSCSIGEGSALPTFLVFAVVRVGGFREVIGDSLPSSLLVVCRVWDFLSVVGLSGFAVYPLVVLDLAPKGLVFSLIMEGLLGCKNLSSLELFDVVWEIYPSGYLEYGCRCVCLWVPWHGLVV